METYNQKTRKDDKTIVGRVPEPERRNDSIFFTDNRPGTIVQQKLRDAVRGESTRKDRPIQCQNNYGLNSEKQLGIYLDNLYKMTHMPDYMETVAKASLLMHCINQQLESLFFPTLEIELKKSLSNGNAANFNPQSWKMQIASDLVTPNLSLAEVLYHEARHSEQFFKMIILQKINLMKNDDIVRIMSVPLAIVKFASTLNPDTILPVSERTSVNRFYESVYGKGRFHRTNVLTNIKTRYEEYLLLPEEEDAWATQGNIKLVANKKVKDLASLIFTTEDVETIRQSLSQYDYFARLISMPPECTVKILKFRIKDWEQRAKALSEAETEYDYSKKNYNEYLLLSHKYNQFATQAKVEKLREVKKEAVKADETEMNANDTEAEKLYNQHPNNWAVRKLVEYIKEVKGRYYAEIIKPSGGSSAWCVQVTGTFLSQIKQAIQEESSEES